jgi:hypothetical protein
MFPNLACSKPTHEKIEEITAICKAELEAAMLDVHIFGGFYGSGEVPSKTIGHFGQWSFTRSWSYWVAKGPGIPVEYAESLHETHGKVVRVAGDCTCPNPRKVYGGFGVGLYHVDTPEGLKALADLLRSISLVNFEIVKAREAKAAKLAAYQQEVNDAITL